MTTPVAQINVSTDTFGTWITRFNIVANAITYNVVTADTTANGSLTTGNATLNGIFTTNTVYTTTLSGGNVATPAVLNITSNVSITNTANITTANITTATIQTSNVNTQNVVTAKVTSLTVNTGTITNANVTTANISTLDVTTKLTVNGSITTQNSLNVVDSAGGLQQIVAAPGTTANAVVVYSQLANAQSIIQNTSSFFINEGNSTEGDLGVSITGHPSAYLFNNPTDWGLFSANAGGVLLSYNRASNNIYLGDSQHRVYISYSIFTNYYETVDSISNSGNTVTLSVENGNVQEVLLSANSTIVLTAPNSTGASSLTVKFKQDSTGGYGITWPTSVKWSYGAVPALTSNANAEDIYTLMTLDQGTTWYGFSSGVNMS